MKTDHLDLWQIHDVRTEEDIAQIFGPGGALEAFVEAREKGLTRFIGVTGHQDPLILRRCMVKLLSHGPQTALDITWAFAVGQKSSRRLMLHGLIERSFSLLTDQ